MVRETNTFAVWVSALIAFSLVFVESDSAIGADDANAGVSLKQHPDNLYPWNRDYSGMMTMKPMLNWGNSFGDHRGLDIDLVGLMDWTGKTGTT